MAVPVALVVLPLGLLFLLSGLIVNFVQAIFFVTIRPFSKSMYRRINRVVAELLWIELVWLVDWWAGVKVELYGDSKTFELMGKEHALLICNHRSDIDWLVGWVLAQRSGCLGSALAVMKKSSKLLPVIGWSMWFTEYLFLERSWAKDENTLKLGLQRLKDFPRPFWLALFVEGTRFTPEKLLAAQEYAASQGLPIPRNVLIPRTKGFVSAVQIMRPFVPAVYDVTVAIPSDQPSPTMLRILKGQPSVVHVHVKRHPLADLPGTDEGVSQWCKDIFVAKDAFLDKYKSEGSFGVEQRQIGRPVKSLLVVMFWFGLLSYATFKFFKWTELLSTWKGVAVTATGLLLVTAVMHIFVRFSQSERSASAKAARNRAKKD
ncbi:1-acyl-sn-glycerol-3-phosphate acyltransferase PLS1-like [Zingiber officinale]|uniref:1-acyl-sn-glycerol-3-phosphate acyltransferase PLS1-like n=1 Tax=Zingiber officinale TaxID=94328 RepID=UPI001C4A8A96|nr:1-acyl-sn-glycerol-3-phosphate acyltransferase PLS1-like [Zingiber officinale]XP_042449671.1 1-acyl-sn-glycerol-3-phosphate acyltransferase PLS1-like [Zingiber officinale]